MSEFKQVVERIVRDHVVPAAEQRDAWSACGEIVPRLPQTLRDQMAVEFLALAYLRTIDDTVDRSGPTPPELRTWPPKKPRLKRQPVALPPDAQAELDAELARIDARLWSNLNRLMEEFTTQVKAEWTAEMLAQPFMLAGGVVTFGEATIEQHREGSLNAQAEGALALERAAQHEAALNELVASSAACLNDHIQSSAA